MNEPAEELVIRLFREMLRDRQDIREEIAGRTPEELRVLLGRIVDDLRASLTSGTERLEMASSLDLPPIVFTLPESLDVPPRSSRLEIVPPSAEGEVMKQQEGHLVQQPSAAEPPESGLPRPLQQPPSMPEIFHESFPEGMEEQEFSEDFADDEPIYLLGAGRIPSESTASASPFYVGSYGVHEEQGVIAWDVEGLRLFVCKTWGQSPALSSSGRMLLGRQEYQDLQWAHERAINELRGKTFFLPIEAGWCFSGKGAVLDAVQDFRADLLRGIESLGGTAKWRLEAFVLDARVAELIGPEESTSHRDHRATDPQRLSAAEGRSRVKSLERLLARERKVAEGVLSSLRESAPTYEVESMIGMSAGSTSDWKNILTAHFNVPPSEREMFFKAVADTQFQHQVFRAILRITGACEHFSFRR